MDLLFSMPTFLNQETESQPDINGEILESEPIHNLMRLDDLGKG